MDEQELRKEFEYLQHEFPLVVMVTLKKYRGMVRCERGAVRELAEKNVWPFVEYVKWHKFEIELDDAHPFKPPVVTWLTEISHPNIIPGERGQVCLSLLGKEWTPRTKLAAVINGLSFLLSDPNPDSTYPNATCIKAAEVCKKYGFPKRGISKPAGAGASAAPPAGALPPLHPPQQVGVPAELPGQIPPQPPVTGEVEKRTFRCPRCSGVFKVAKLYPLQRTRCPYCGAAGIV